MMDGVDLAKTIECVIFIVSLMTWGGFLVFMVAAYKVRKLNTERDELKCSNSILEARVETLTQELQELRREHLSHRDMADKVISMLRAVEYTIGYDPRTPLGQIAKVARQRWFEVQALQESARWHTKEVK